MKLSRHSRMGAIAAVGALALTLTACGSDDPVGQRNPTAGSTGGSTATDEPTAELEGSLAGAGASSQGSAMDAWRAGFQNMHSGVTVSYDPVGSGGGRTQFIQGGTSFAGSDSAIDGEQLEQAIERCVGTGIIQAPLYISPIAIIYNLPSVPELNLSPSLAGKIFNQQITQWNDPEIVAENPDADLPDLPITTVNRSDESGTTDNFTDWLAATAGADWPHEPSGDWPLTGTQSAQGTSGVVQTVEAAEGTIGYADASRAGTLGTARVLVGDEYVAYTPEAAAKVVDASPRDTSRDEHDIVVEIDRTTTEAGAYPLVLIAYSIACLEYEDPAEGELVQAFLSYVASDEGQQAAAGSAGSAPISDALRSDVEAALAAMTIS